MVAQPSNSPWDYSSAGQFPPVNDTSLVPTPPAISRSYLSPPALSGWDLNSPSLWHKPVAGNVEFSLPTEVDDDPFTRAARRTRQAVQPPDGRRDSSLIRFLENYPLMSSSNCCRCPSGT